MNPRDMDAFYDAILAYTEAKSERDADIPWIKYDVASSESPGYLRKDLGIWNTSLEDDPHTASNAWLKDIFESKVTYRTDERERRGSVLHRSGSYPIRKFDSDLQVGDTTELDSFLASFHK